MVHEIGEKDDDGKGEIPDQETFNEFVGWREIDGRSECGESQKCLAKSPKIVAVTVSLVITANEDDRCVGDVRNVFAEIQDTRQEHDTF